MSDTSNEFKISELGPNDVPNLPDGEIWWVTTITWNNSDHQMHPELDAERKEINTRLYNDGHIRRQPVFVDDSTTKRFWPTEEIAEFYISEMQRLAAKHNVVIVSASVDIEGTPTSS